jgi:cleavage and polyadenylation specificity factor subunit 2
MTKVQFCPLLELEKDGAVANLLRIDSVTVLLDCGWTQAFDPALLQPIIDILSEVTIILISHPTLEYVGALPYLAKQPGFHASIYATLPVARMGQMVLYDAYISHAKCERFSMLTIEGINSTFELVNQLKYSEKFPVKGSH